MRGDGTRRLPHGRATLLAVVEGRGLGYELDGVAYGLVSPVSEPTGQEAARVALLHAGALDLREVEVQRPTVTPLAVPEGLRVTHASDPGSLDSALQAARLSLALSHLAEEQPVPEHELEAVRREHASLPPGEVVIHADGSADKEDGSLSVGYTLNGRPYAAFFLYERGHEHLAEREAIRLALAHARVLGYGRFRVRSDHKFHVRRYAEGLVHPGRRKAASLERLDALVAQFGPTVHFEHTGTYATDAPHRLAVHARALHRLALGQALSRAEGVALRRVHFALRARGAVPY